MPRSAWVAIGAAVGAIWLGPLAISTAIVMLAAGGIAAVAPWLPSRRRRTALLLAAGAGMVVLRLGAIPVDPPSSAAPEGRGPWSMLVENLGSPRDGRQVATLRSIGDAATGSRLAATLPRYPPVEPGDVVEVTGRVRPRPDSPYGRYLEQIGAWGSLDADSLTMLASGDSWSRTLERLRRAAGDALRVTLPEPEAGLAAGILIGLRDRVDRGLAAAFTTAGVSHVVAISGWNIAIVAAAITALTGGLGRRRRAIVTVIAISAYVAFAGASPSVLRAGAMAGVVLVARESGRAGYAATALGWAVTILLVVQPTLIIDAGFQLSTVATAGLIAWAAPLGERIDRISHGRLPRWLVESLGVSLAAQAATLPIVMASFGRLSLIAPGVNLVVVPLIAPAMAAGIVALGAGAAVALGVPSAVGAVLAAPAWAALKLIVWIVEAAATLPMASIELEQPAGTIAGAATALAVTALLVAPRRRFRAPPLQAESTPGGRSVARATPAPAGRAPNTKRLGRAATLALATSVVVTGGVIAVRPPGIARVIVLDVGQGDAILVEGRDGGRLLIDGGPDPDRLLVVLDGHVPPWDRRIDAVILTHPHEDHVAGLALLLDRYHVAKVFEPGMRGPGPGYAAWADRLDRPQAPARLGLATGDHLAVDDVQLRVLWPDAGRVPMEPPDSGTDINNVSIVLLGEVGERRFLLTGDIEEDVDPYVLARGLSHVDLLKVAHHGSRTATTEAFVEATHPSVAVASAGTGNPYGHPTRSTLDRLRAAGARVYRTDQDGTVAVAFGATGMTIRREPRPVSARVDAIRRAASVGTTQVGSTAASAATLLAPIGSPTSSARAPFDRAAPLRRYACAIPGPPATAARTADPAMIEGALAAAAPMSDPGRHDGWRHRLGYHRIDDGPLAGSSRCPAALAGSTGVGAQARTRRGRDRSLARPTHGRARDASGSRRGGRRGAAARCGQAAAAGGNRARPPPR